MGRGQVISFCNIVQKKGQQDLRTLPPGMAQQQELYACYVTLERLNGYCDLLIRDRATGRADWFFLRFSPEGIIRYTTLEQAEVPQWLERRAHCSITYLQAIRLLGDAVRQRYKYHESTDWIPEAQSVHLRRIWQEEYYRDAAGDISWFLPKQECSAMLQTWLQALGNKDAVLLYDLSASQVQGRAQRSLFAHCWSHALEDFKILGYEVDRESVLYNGMDDYTLSLTVYGSSRDRQMLSVELRLRLVEEQAGFRILHDQVLESRSIYQKPCCGQ